LPNYSVLAVSVEGSPRGCLTIREAPTSKVGEVHANVKTIKTADEMLGTLLDVKI